jgi:hypothetical protein
MAERLAAMADESGSWKGPETVTTDACAERGIAWLLEDFPEAPLSPAELLTARYATGEDRKAWAYRLTPMPPLQAFSAVQADPEAAHDAITAALTLLPDLHAALDTAAADLQRRAPQPASVPLDPAGVLPADWVRFVSPPWGARLDQVKPTCVRTKTGGTACTRQAAEWPASFAEMADPQACWSHLDEPEREACERARASYRAAFWELKNAHYETAGHTRDERCEGCTWPSGQQPAVNF